MTEYQRALHEFAAFADGMADRYAQEEKDVRRDTEPQNGGIRSRAGYTALTDLRSRSETWREAATYARRFADEVPR